MQEEKKFSISNFIGYTWKWLWLSFAPIRRKERNMEEEIKKQQILQKSLSLSNLDTFSIEKKKKEIESGIKKEKIMKSLESIPSLNLVNKFSKTTASILIYKILCIQFPHY